MAQHKIIKRAYVESYKQECGLYGSLDYWVDIYVEGLNPKRYSLQASRDGEEVKSLVQTIRSKTPITLTFSWESDPILDRISELEKELAELRKKVEGR